MSSSEVSQHFLRSLPPCHLCETAEVCGGSRQMELALGDLSPFAQLSGNARNAITRSTPRILILQNEPTEESSSSGYQ